MYSFLKKKYLNTLCKIWKSSLKSDLWWYRSLFLSTSKIKVLIVPASVRNSLRLHKIAPLCNGKHISGTTLSSSKNFRRGQSKTNTAIQQQLQCFTAFTFLLLILGCISHPHGDNVMYSPSFSITEIIFQAGKLSCGEVKKYNPVKSDHF